SAVTCPGAAGPGRAGPGGRPAQRGCAPRPAPLPARAGASGGWPVACGSVTGGQRSCVLSEGRRTVAADQAKEAALPAAPHHPVSAAAAEAFISRTCFKTGPPRLVGVELEWLLHDPSDLAAPVVSSRLDGLLSPTEIRGALSTEPGGQFELSSRPHPTLGGCLAETAADLAVARDAAAQAGV